MTIDSARRGDYAQPMTEKDVVVPPDPRKTEAEIQKLRAETALIRAQQQVSWIRTTTAVVGVLALVVGLLKAVADVAATARSIQDAQAAAQRQDDAHTAEMKGRAEAVRLADAAEIRLKESSTSEIDTKVLNTYVNDILPRVSGTSGYHLSERCLEDNLRKGVDPNEAGLRCAGPVQLPRAAQVAAYFAAVALARRYPMLCSATRAAIENQQGDASANKALAELGACPAP